MNRKMGHIVKKKNVPPPFPSWFLLFSCLYHCKDILNT